MQKEVVPTANVCRCIDSRIFEPAMGDISRVNPRRVWLWASDLLNAAFSKDLCFYWRAARGGARFRTHRVWPVASVWAVVICAG
jgi:hypothetical protein